MARQKVNKNSASSLLSMIRPANSFLVGFAVVVGIAITSNNYREIFSSTSLFGFLTGFFISSFSMVSNDIYDYEVDRVNQPTRSLPSGSVTIRQATTFSIILLILGLASSLVLGLANLGIATLFALIGWYYNYRGKQSGLFGNFLVALTSFLAGMGREILKGISDIEGDRIRKVRTVASIRGIGVAKTLSAVF